MVMKLYMCSNQVTVNGLTAYLLDTVNTNACSLIQVQQYAYLGIRVFIRHADGSETEITNDYVARYPVPSWRTGCFASTWDCPGVTMSPDDSIVVRVYGCVGIECTGWFPVATFTTKQLKDIGNYSGLAKSRWTVYYCFYNYEPYIYFIFGCSSLPSSIDGVEFITAPAPAPSPTPSPTPSPVPSKPWYQYLYDWRIWLAILLFILFIASLRRGER